MTERGPYAKGRARREEILQTALRVLSERGYRNTSLRGIGRELGIQPAHILHYFSSREELLEEVLRAWDGSPAADAPEGDVVGGDQLEGWLEAIERNTTIPGLVHLYTAFAAEAADENHPSHAFFQNRFANMRRQVAEGIREKQASGVFRADVDPDATATKLIAVSDGLQLQWLIDPEIDMVAQMRETIALFETLREPPAA